MAYVDPQTVLTPRDRVRAVHVLYNSGPQNGWSWSVALLDFDGEEHVGIRWNGSDSEPGIGNPQSRGRPTWFVLPEPLATAVREQAEELADSQEGGLLASYREMAADREREAEAEEWSEGLIGDAIDQEG